MRELLKSYLKPVAREFIETSTLADTKKLVCSGREIDLIALDLRFPDSTYAGTISMIHEFRDCNPDAILIVITGNADPSLEKKAIEAGAHGFMFKPAVSRPDTFLSTLAALAKSLIRNPTKYTRNLELAEKILAKITPRLEEMKPSGDIGSPA